MICFLSGILGVVLMVELCYPHLEGACLLLRQYLWPWQEHPSTMMVQTPGVQHLQEVVSPREGGMLCLVVGGKYLGRWQVEELIHWWLRGEDQTDVKEELDWVEDLERGLLEVGD